MSAGVGPEVAVVQFDHHSAEFAADPYRVANEIRDRCPVSYSTAYGGFWVVSGHREATEAFRDYATFSSAQGVTVPDLVFGTTHIPITVDPPEQFLYRKFLMQFLSKEALEGRQAAIHDVIFETVGGLAGRGSWDFVSDLGAIIPAVITLSILGLGADRRVEFSTAMARGMENVGTSDPTLAAQIEHDRAWMVEQITQEIARRRVSDTGDLFSHLVRGRLSDGRSLSESEIIDISMLLLIGGFHTTNAALASGVLALQTDPDLRRRLIEDRSLVPAFIEEVIRVYAPSTGMARTLTRDCELGEATLRAGEKAYLFIMAANRDPRQFEHPERVDLDRDQRGNGSLAWGWGVHRCIGIHLARLVLRFELEAILELMPGFTIDLSAVRLSSEVGVAYMHSTVPARL